MGTLHNQPVRSRCSIRWEDVRVFVQEVKEIAESEKVAVSEVIAAMDVMERPRQNDLYVNNGDVFDEQISGVGAALEGLAEALSSGLGNEGEGK